MAKKEIFLIVEDDLKQLMRYKELVDLLGYDVYAVNNKSDAISIIEHKSVSILLSDIHLTGSQTLDGLKIIEYAKTNSPEVLLLAMSSDPNVEIYHKVLNAGALTFVKKPIVNKNEIALGVEVAKEKQMLQKTTRALFKVPNISKEVMEKCPDGIVLSERLRIHAKKIAIAKRLPTIILGETGTGKEEFAKLVHRERCKKDGALPFISVNCGNIDDNMAASLLFGHVKGAFTGAVATTTGYIGDANGGILFLDEIHCLSKSMQQRLLRVLNDGTYQRLGDTKELISTFQLICATTKNLDHEVKKGTFMLDLHMRITGPNVTIPPLRERLDEIPLLVSLFLSKERIIIPREEYKKIVKKCQSYYWQGNIRQLHRAIQTLIGMSEFTGSLSVEDLPFWESMLHPEKVEDENLIFAVTPSSKEDLLEVMSSVEKDGDINIKVDNYEKLIIRNALARHDNVQDAAYALRIARSTFDSKRKKHGMFVYQNE